MSAAVVVWLAGTVILAYLAGASLLHVYSSPSADDVKTRRYSARILLASPIWPLLILAAAGYALLTLVRWAR